MGQTDPSGELHLWHNDCSLHLRVSLTKRGDAMSTLTLDLILSPGGDFESKQYRVLQGLKESYDRFSHNQLYPDLTDLIHLAESLTGILSSHGNVRAHLPHVITDLDLEKKKVILEPVEVPFPELAAVIDFVVWTLPQIKRAIDEGMTIFNFVEEHISIEEVGIMPMYNQEGYWLVPDLHADKLHLLRYEMALFSSAQERFRTLKTVLLDTLEEKYIKHSPESVKIHLLEKFVDMPNPATYRCDVDIEFPFQETMLPVAKRKFITRLVA